jgi:acyl carrier protein
VIDFPGTKSSLRHTTEETPIALARRGVFAVIERIQELIIETANELTEDEEIEISEPVGPTTTLFGPDGVLDSMGLVSLVIAVEQAIEETFEILISLADEKALSQKHSPYSSVSALASYAVAEIEARKNADA